MPTALIALLLLCCFTACHAQDAVVLDEGYEANLDVRVQLRGSNQPYEQQALALSTERAHGGIHSLKAEFLLGG